jgi:hypothetical protein
MEDVVEGDGGFGDVGLSIQDRLWDGWECTSIDRQQTSKRIQIADVLGDVLHGGQERAAPSVVSETMEWTEIDATLVARKVEQRLGLRQQSGLRRLDDTTQTLLDLSIEVGAIGSSEMRHDGSDVVHGTSVDTRLEQEEGIGRVDG